MIQSQKIHVGILKSISTINKKNIQLHNVNDSVGYNEKKSIQLTF